MFKKSFLAVVVVIMIAFSNANIPGPSIRTQPQSIKTEEPPVIKISPTVPINVVFIGFDQTNILEQEIDQNITKYYSPVISQWDYPYYNVNYTLDLNYYYSDNALETDFANYLLANSFMLGGTIPDLDYYDSTATDVRIADANTTLHWLDNNINDYFADDINSSYTLYLIDTYSGGYITDYYYYLLDFVDPDTGLDPDEVVTTLYGGEYPSRGVFLDLSAGPVYYHDTDLTEANEGDSDDTIIPIWEYLFPDDQSFFADQLAEYIQETIDLVFTPSYLYIPEIRDNVEINIVLFDDYTFSQADQIDIDVIANAFAQFVPYFDVSVTLTLDTMDNYPDLETVMNDSDYDDGYGNQVIDTRPVVDYLQDNLDQFGMTDNTWPVFLWAWENQTKWLTSVGTLGVGFDDGFGNPSMVAMGYDPRNGNSYEGYTATIIHEVGHLMSLRHPHDGISFDRLEEGLNAQYLDWLRDFISTPMTYAFPDTTFSTFDFDQIDRGYALNRINETMWNIYLANSTLVDKGYTDLSLIPDAVETHLNDSLDALSSSFDLFHSMDYQSSFLTANSSYFESVDYMDMVTALSDYVPPSTSTTTTSTSTTSSSSSSSTSSSSSSSSTGSSTTSNTISSSESSEPVDTSSDTPSVPLSTLSIFSSLAVMPIIYKKKSNKA